MDLIYKKVLIEEANDLARWLTSDSWPTFTGSYKDEKELLKIIKEGSYIGEEEESFWIIQNEKKVGLIEIYDLNELAPMFSIRIKTEKRRAGIGRNALIWLCDYFFNHYSDKRRLEAQTREDNIPMRKLLSECFFAQEAYYRKAWPHGDDRLASVAYGLLREDWINKEITPVHFE